MTSPVRRLRRLLGALCLAALCAGAPAQPAWPDRPIRLMVPFPPAGVTDILGRILAERLGALYGQTVVVENRGGASGHIGAQQVAKAPADGYTLMVGTIGIHAAHASYRKLNYDPAAELQPVMILGEAANLVLVPAASKYRTFAEFLADAKARPGQITYASAGPGSSVHMVTALFELAGGVKMTHVPYKGSGPALIDLIGGQVDVMFDNFSSSIAHVKSGKLRVLAVTSGRRDPRLPEVPAIAEAGVPGYAGTSWWTLAAPRDVPAELIRRINRDALQVLAAPEAVAQLDKLGITITPNTPAEAAAYFQSETAKWNRVIEAAKVHLD